MLEYPELQEIKELQEDVEYKQHLLDESRAEAKKYFCLKLARKYQRDDARRERDEALGDCDKLRSEIAALELVLQNRELQREQVDVVATLRTLQRELTTRLDTMNTQHDELALHVADMDHDHTQRLQAIGSSSEAAARSSGLAVSQLMLRAVPKVAAAPKSRPPAPERDPE